MERREEAQPASSQALDAVGEQTLEIFAASESYNRFLWESLNRLSPVQGRVLEVGCGIGNLTRLILEDARVSAVHGIDMEPAYVQRLLASIDDGRLSASAGGIEAFRPPDHPEGADERYDRVVCSNVLEHIEDHVAAMADFRRLLRPGGEALILVPAHRWLYCDLDRNLSHHRRYTVEDLEELETKSGLELVRSRHFNPLGVFGWWLNGKVLRRGVLPESQMTVYTRLAIPVSRILDRLNPFPLGISLLALYRKAG